MSSKLKYWSIHWLSLAAGVALAMVALHLGLDPKMNLNDMLPTGLTQDRLVIVLLVLSSLLVFSCQIVEFDKKGSVFKRICFLGLIPWRSRRYSLENFTSIHLVRFHEVNAKCNKQTYLLALSGSEANLQLSYFPSQDKIEEFARQIEEFCHLKVSREASCWASWNRKKNPAAYELPPEDSIRGRILEFLFRTAKKASSRKRNDDLARNEETPLEKARANAVEGKKLLAIIQYKKHLREHPDDTAASEELAKLEQA